MVQYWTLMVKVHNIAGPIIMLAYPLYASVSAIESPLKEDDTQWLTYWVLYSLVQLVEIGFERVLAWFPFLYTVKLVAMCWLVLPQFNGAAFIYENYVKKYIGVINDRMNNGRMNEYLSLKQRPLAGQMSPSARASVSAFISEHGPDAFDKLMASINETNRKNKSPSYATRYRGSPSAVQPTRYTGSPTAAQPTKSTGSPTAAQPTRYTGSPTAAQPTRYTGSPEGSPRSPDSPTGSTGSPTSRGNTKVRKSDSFREYYRQPVRILKTSLRSLDSRRHDIRSKVGTHFVE